MCLSQKKINDLSDRGGSVASRVEVIVIEIGTENVWKTDRRFRAAQMGRG